VTHFTVLPKVKGLCSQRQKRRWIVFPLLTFLFSFFGQERRLGSTMNVKPYLFIYLFNFNAEGGNQGFTLGAVLKSCTPNSCPFLSS
jgi:hypothetical protein